MHAVGNQYQTAFNSSCPVAEALTCFPLFSDHAQRQVKGKKKAIKCFSAEVALLRFLLFAG